MQVIRLACGPTAHQHDITLPALPTQRDLKFLEAIARTALPVDNTPSLEEIQRQPDVKPLGEPQPAPQRPLRDVRLAILGTDAALAAVFTRLMRQDDLWMQVAFVPTAPSAAARNWQLPREAYDFAMSAPARPTPLIRDDAGIAVAGNATITEWDNAELTGEIIVDDHVMLHSLQQTHNYGARLVPTLGAPGLAAVKRVATRDGWLSKEFDRSTLATGRALQVGGENIRVTVDSISRKRAVDKATFYRHLRDCQVVRP